MEQLSTPKPTLEQKMIPQNPVVKDTSPLALRELIEKNLKWSQILYEQNRRINRKLFWTAVARWIQLLVTLGVVGLGVVYAPRWAASLQKEIRAITTSLIQHN
jgi:hypothetical protein